MTSPESSGFASALEAVAGVEGWLSDEQARRLWERATAVGAGGRIVEIGSYRGRSAIVLARAAGGDVEVVAIDPQAGNDRGPQQIHGTSAEGDADHAAFLANLSMGGVAERVRHVRRGSLDALDDVSGEVDLLYVDGAHRYGPARADLARWGARVRPGGTLLVHDAFSSIGVTVAIVRVLLGGSAFRYVGRVGSLAEYRRVGGVAGAPGRLTSAARQVAQLPWFLRNVAVKLALVAGARPVARALGHRSGDWPY